MFANLVRQATVLTLVRGSKVATFFDTWASRNNEERAVLLRSSITRSVFNETTEGWTIQFPPVGKQNRTSKQLWYTFVFENETRWKTKISMIPMRQVPTQ